MIVQLKNGKVLKKIIESIKDLLTDVNIKIDNNGLSIQAMDASHVSVCNVSIYKSSFDVFDGVDKTYCFGVNVSNLDKIFKCMMHDMSVSLESFDIMDKIGITFHNEKNILEFHLNLMEIEQDEIEIPEQEFECVFELESNDAYTHFKNLLSIGETCSIKSINSELTIETVGDFSNMKIKLPNEKIKDINNMYSLKYINFFMKACSLSEKVTVKMIQDCPVLFEYDINDYGIIKYFLAPKIEE